MSTSETKHTIEQRAQAFYESFFDDALVHLIDVADGDKQPNEREREDGIADEWTARERLEEYHYGIDKETVYYITLAGGGPAARIKVTVEHGEVTSAVLQFCDWFERWTDAPRQDPELVERYAGLVMCDEGDA
jgi:hypothetical protein